MPIRRTFAIAVLTLAIPFPGMGVATAADKPSLSAREIRYEVQCPSPRDVPCAIKKPALSGYRVLTEKISLDDQGSYWIANLSKARQQQGKNEPIRILSDNGVWHLIEVKYVPAPAVTTARKKPDDETDAVSKKPGPDGSAKSPGKAKDSASPAAKATPKVEACYERCRSTPG